VHDVSPYQLRSIYRFAAHVRPEKKKAHRSEPKIEHCEFSEQRAAGARERPAQSKGRELVTAFQLNNVMNKELLLPLLYA
jgi:hypothetical protein